MSDSSGVTNVHNMGMEVNNGLLEPDENSTQILHLSHAQTFFSKLFFNVSGVLYGRI